MNLRRAAIAVCITALSPSAAFAADAPCMGVSLKCAGFEPNWYFEMQGRDTLVFTDPENPDWQTKPLIVSACAQRLAGGTTRISAGAPLELSAIVEKAQCTAPNDDVHPYRISIKFRQGTAQGAGTPVSGTGCCWR